MTAATPSREQEVVERALVDHLGLLPRSLWQRHVPNAVTAAAAALGTEREALLGALALDASVAEVVAGFLMVGETHFLRHPEQFETAREHLVAAAHRDASRPLRVWSAGCATGEEPYSLLLVLRSRAPQIAPRVEVLATDLDPAAIRAAGAGVFGAWSFRQRTLEWTRPFFTAAPERRVLLPELRRRVEFRCEPIERTLAKTPPGVFDLVLFRNVGIYLDEAARDRIFAGIRRVLRDDGRLVVSPTDPRPGRDAFVADGEAPTCWFRPARGEARSAVGAASAPAPRTVSGLAAAPDRRSAAGSAGRRPACGTGGPPAPPGPRAAPPELRPEPPPAASPRPSAAASAEERARALADRGEVAAAIAVLEEVVAGSLAALRLRGCLHLAAGSRQSALADLRNVLYHHPGDRLARFWLALVLLELGQRPRALRHLCQLEHLLAPLPPGAAVEDGTTTVEELLRAVRERLLEIP